MVQNDIHRLHVFLFGEGKTKEAGWFLASLLAFVKGCGRKLFFACSGNGNGTTWNNRGGNGNYWSASFNSARNARNLNFNSGGVNPQNNNNRYNGFAVRPVQHTILTILFLMIYGTDTSAATLGSVSGILRCETSQVETVLRKSLGEELESKHGELMRGFVSETIQASSIEMLHRGLSEEEGDIRCRVQGPYSTSSILQLLSWSVRENIYPRYLFVHQGSWYSLRHWTHNGFLSERKSELESQVLRNAFGYKRLLYAHSTKETLGDCYWLSEKDGFAYGQERFGKDMGRYSGLGLCSLADRDNSNARSEEELCHRRLRRGLDRLRSCKVDASPDRRIRITNRKLDESAFLECLPERVRSVHEESLEVQVLWSLCGRCSRSFSRQRVAIITCARDKEILEDGVRLRAAHGKAGNIGSASRSRVSWCLRKAIQDLYLESCSRKNETQDSRVRFLKALEGGTFGKFLFRHILPYCFIQSVSQAIDDERYSENRHIQQRYDQVYRQKTIL